jgi:hypothetical protein
MKTITVYVSVGLAGCKREVTFEVDDDATDEEIEETAEGCLESLLE